MAPVLASRFFKTGPGDYAADDRFLGITVPDLRKIAKNFKELSMPQIRKLIKSSFNEERLLALLILVHQYQRGSREKKSIIFEFYLKNTKYINNWNLVDASAHYIVGAHLFDQNAALLLKLAESTFLWERRIAIVATWYFIRQNELLWTLKIAKKLIQDDHDLIHKATGWMLREVGKKDEATLISFLNIHGSKMPRTMLRYAIERLSDAQRKNYLSPLKI
jgi:3-methyladenine DNA glycosylase AlkD